MGWNPCLERGEPAIQRERNAILATGLLAAPLLSAASGAIAAIVNLSILGNVAATTGPWWIASNFSEYHYPGTNVPLSFNLEVLGEEYNVIPDATKHMAEYALQATTKAAEYGLQTSRDFPISSLAGAIEQAQTVVQPGSNLIQVGEWELGINTINNNIFHAVYNPNVGFH